MLFYWFEYSIYVNVICLNSQDPFGQNRGTFDFEKLLSRINTVHSKLKS